MGLSDESCTSPNVKYSELSPKVHLVKDIYIENGAGGGGGASYVFLVSFKTFINNLLNTEIIWH